MKIYKSPKVECTTLVLGSLICGLSGTNDSGSGTLDDPGKTTPKDAPIHRAFF